MTSYMSTPGFTPTLRGTPGAKPSIGLSDQILNSGYPTTAHPHGVSGGLIRQSDTYNSNNVAGPVNPFLRKGGPPTHKLAMSFSPTTPNAPFYSSFATRHRNMLTTNPPN